MRADAALRKLAVLLEALGLVLFTSCSTTLEQRNGFLARVPVQIASSIVFVPVTVNGEGPYRFELDTGFQNCAVERTLAKRLGLQVGPLEHVEAPGGTVERATITGAQLAVAGQGVANARISSLDLTEFGPLFGRAPDGILGYDFLRSYVVVLDYENHVLEIHDPASFQYHPSGTAVRLDTSSRQPYVTAAIETADGRRAEGRFLIDTGSIDAVNLNAPFAKEHAIESSSPRVFSVHGRSIGGETNGLLVRIGALDIGDLRFPAPITSIVDEAVDRAGQISGGGGGGRRARGGA